MAENPAGQRCRLLVPFATGILFLGSPCQSAGQSLDLLRHEVREKDIVADTAPPPPPRRKQCDDEYLPPDVRRSDHDDDADKDGFWGKSLLWGLTSPLWLPGMWLGDEFGLDGCFPPYPYFDGLDGSMLIHGPGEVFARPWSGRLSLEGTTKGGDVERLGGRLLLSTRLRLDLDSEWNWLTESTAAGKDELALGDLNFVLRIAQTQRIQMRSGVGFNWLADDGGADFGFNFTYGADLFPIKPLVLSTVIDWGTLHHASLFHARGTVGITWKRLEIFAGYDFRRIGVVDFQGPIAGVQLYF